MTIQQLECFLALAERLNFTQTANDLFMAQTTLSRSISALEQELGMTLFRRSSRTVELTAAGRAFRDECAGVLDGYSRAVSAARMAEKGYRGELRLGVLHDTFDARAIELYRTMRSRYPEVRIDLREHNHSGLVSRLMGGETDAIIDFGSFEPMPEQEALCMSESRQCAVMPSDWDLARRDSIRVEELRGRPFVVMTQSASQPGYTFLWKTVTNAGFIPEVAAEAAHVPVLLMHVACGRGVTFLMDNIPNPDESLISFVPLEDVPASRQSIIWLKKNENPALPLLLNTARELF